MGQTKIVVFTDWYAPGYKAGGPIRSVSNLVALLGSLYNFTIITSDTDFGETKPYEGVIPNKWVKVPQGQVMYLNRKHTMFSFLARKVIVKKEDLIYLNSMFSFRFTLMPLFFFKWVLPIKRIVIAPRGMLGKSSLEIKSSKKQLFLRLVKVLRLFKHVVWHATSTTEKEDIQLYFGRQTEIFVIPNVPTISNQPLAERNKQKGSLRLIFCSRISAIKNLILALEVLITMAKELKGRTIEFDIYGPVEDENYWKSCKLLMQQLLDSGIKTKYCGALLPDKVQEVFTKYHFLFLPTAHENYGHVIVEAMTTGLPVLISRDTPWRNLEQQKAGWDIDIADRDKFVGAIRNCLEMNQSEYDALSLSTCYWIRKQIDLDQLRSRLQDLFQNH
jgi:glycosyltransferase involved in cell wall biosynthesis